MTSRQSLLTRFRPSQDAPGLRTKGFTLVELMVALGVSTIVLTAVYGVYAGLTRSYTTQNVAADMQQVMRAGIDFMVEDIIAAGLNPNETAGIGIAVATSTSIRFSADRDLNGTLDPCNSEEISYNYNAGGSQLNQCLDPTIGTAGCPADCDPFIDNVTAITFSYLDAAGNDLGDPVAAADLNDIRTVAISMTVQEPAGRQGLVARTYSTRFRCRNLGI